MIYEELAERDLEVFYDANEQHRIVALDVEAYLRPIYQSEARFVVVLLGQTYPKKVWTKFESESFKERFSDGSVIPIWFSDVPQAAFDESRKYGGMEFDRSKPVREETKRIADILIAKLTDSK